MIPNHKLIQLGFDESPVINDQGLIYKSFDYSSNGSHISINNILNTYGEAKKQIITINDREIPKTLSYHDILNFIKIIA